MYQQITILGNVGNDPSADQRFTPSGVAVVNLSVAVNRKWTGQDGQQQEKTTWFKVACWRKLAEVVGQYVKKGQQVLVIGEMEDPDVYTDKSGETRATLRVTATQVKFIGSRDNASAPAQQAQGNAGADLAQAHHDADIPF